MSGDGGIEVIKDYLDQTADNNINLDVFVGNSAAGFDPVLEKQVITDKKYSNRLNIIREHPRGSIKDDEGLIKSTTAKTHTKLYAWYNAKNELLAFWLGSANFTKNGVKNTQSFREILLEMPLELENWKENLICKVVGAFKTEPSQRIQDFCR
ncbi:restriction endonuclease PLD domain-containing protein [Spiroplasma poulsonii]|uniref:restriction endonuclease PLD domain-containing protein n=1 Tax=Spiroplasma poulsonii TaxID=2138 RepID=UPI001F541D6B|nr:restriction endonuclease PLD domain-containing protein [Spiroplasma poulsonii]